MHHQPCRLITAAAFNAALVLSVYTSALAQDYYAVDLGTFGTYGDTSGIAINNRGTVIGTSSLATRPFETSAPVHAFKYKAGNLDDIGTLGGNFSTALDINNRGAIVGSAASPGDGFQHAYVYRNGIMKDLGLFGGAFATATAINDAGTIVVYAFTISDQTLRSFEYRNGKVTDIGNLGGKFTSAVAINNSGMIVGESSLPGEQLRRAFSYSRKGIENLGSLGGQTSSALAINNSGEIAGYSDLGDAQGSQHAFRYRKGQMIDLGVLADRFSAAMGINDTGTIVGISETLGYPGVTACIWERNTPVDLNELIDQPDIYLESASDINNSGEIVADGFDNHAYLLLPLFVPDDEHGHHESCRDNPRQRGERIGRVLARYREIASRRGR